MAKRVNKRSKKRLNRYATFMALTFILLIGLFLGLKKNFANDVSLSKKMGRGVIDVPINITMGSSSDIHDTKSEDIFAALDVDTDKPINIKFGDEGSEYIDTSECTPTSKSCYLKLTNTENLSSKFVFRFTVKYTIKTTGEEALGKVTINVDATKMVATAWYDNRNNQIGTFNFGGDWEPHTGERTNGQRVNSYVTSNPNATLPNISKLNNDMYTFKGWLPNAVAAHRGGGGDSNSGYIYADEECSNAIPAGSKVEIGNDYAPCFEMNDKFVKLVLSTGVVNEGSWEEVKGERGNYIAYSKDGNGSITLPNVVYNFDNTSLGGWKNSRTKEVLTPGTSVPFDGTSYLAIAEVKHEEAYLEKVIYKDRTEVFTSSGMTYCGLVNQSDSEYLSVSPQAGDCRVTGKKVTTSPVEVLVKYEEEDGAGGTNKEEVVYLFSVIESSGTVADPNNGEFIIDPNVNDSSLIGPDGQYVEGSTGGEGNNSKKEKDFITRSCDTFDISWGGGSWVSGGFGGTCIGNQGSNVTCIQDGTNTLRSNPYTVKAKCAGQPEDGYIAFCLDPGRKGPDTGAQFRYQRVADIDLNSDFGRLINSFVEDGSVEQMSSASNIRTIAHVSSRLMAIISGYSSSGSAYPTHEGPYVAAANAIRSCDNYNYDCVYNALKSKMRMKDLFAIPVAQKISEIKSSAAGAEEDKATGKFKREITNTTVTPNGNGYTITYEGTITTPSNVTITGLEGQSSNSKYGVSLSGSISSTGSSEAGNVYSFTATVTAADVANVKTPKNIVEKAEAAFLVRTNGNSTLASAFLADSVYQPATLQRMLIFSTAPQGLYLYFNILPKDCDLLISQAKECVGDNSQKCKDFKKTFLDSGCCANILDEKENEELFEMCGNECITNTMSNVCDYTDPSKKAEIYEIREGTRNNNNHISGCIANTDKEITATNASKNQFLKTDSKGHPIHVKEYTDKENRYCRVNCREEWQLSMDAFGSFVGADAVAAGTYFQINNDLFMGSKETCYTNHINTIQFKKDLVEESEKVVDAYNEYLILSKIYADIEDQIGNSSRRNIDFDGSVDLYKEYYDGSESHSWHWKYEYDDPENPHKVTGKHCDDSLSFTAPTPKESSKDIYNNYSLETNGDLFKGDKNFNNNVQDDGTKNVAKDRGADSYYASVTLSCDVTDYPPSPSDPACQTTYTHKVPQGSDSITGGHCDITIRAPHVNEVIPWTPSPTKSPNTSSAREEAFNKMTSELKKALKPVIEDYYNRVNSSTQKAQSYAEQMFDCQHFHFTTPDNTSSKGGKYGTSGSRNYVDIKTTFDPKAKYTYAEDAFMTILLRNDENVLEPYVEKNNSLLSGWDQPTTHDKTSVNVYGLSEPLELAKNFEEYHYYKDDNGQLWQQDTAHGDNYEGVAGSSSDNDVKNAEITLCSIGAPNLDSPNSKGIFTNEFVKDKTPAWKAGKGICQKVNVTYLESNYIKASIQNSSFYKNKGTWYGSSGDDKVHGDDLAGALSSEVSHNDNAHFNVDNELKSGRWSPIGIMNVFPVSITTPRNLYTYKYGFYDIGNSIQNGSSLGRIMGHENSVIESNTRTCFYEVFEELCLCCGDEINTIVYDDVTDKDLIEQLMGTHNYPTSNPEKIKDNTAGTLGFSPSSVNLSDLFSSGRDVPSNWGDSSKFIYGGEYDLTTKKGADLLNALQDEGEAVYTEEPEYSYVLTPSTLQNIIQENKSRGYEVNYNELKAYGRTPIDEQLRGHADNDAMNKNVINFQHYGSLFLESLQNNTDVASPRNLTRLHDMDLNNCYVTSGFTAEQIKEKKKSCRWIDYVETGSHYTYPYNVVGGASSTNRFRLAFK